MNDPSTRPAPLYRRILVPVDGSLQSDRSLDVAVVLARAQGSSLRLLAVLDETRYVHGFEPTRVVLDEILPRARREIDALLQAARARAAAQGVDAEIERVIEGTQDIPSIVVSQAMHWQADLVVVGTHGRRGLDRLLLGSVAEAILRRCPVPVLLVRTADEANAQVAVA